jgi:nitroreductase
MNADSTIETKARALRDIMSARRSVRRFDASRPVPRDVVLDCVAIAASAPSGANMQPWTFVVVADPDMKRAIRTRAETVERDFYRHRAPAEWKERLAPLGTDAHKPFLEDAPLLVCVFVQRHGVDAQGAEVRHYWPTESCSIAVGFLLCALHQLGLGSLTYTPSPAGFLCELLGRPSNERPLMIVAVGYPAPEWVPPSIGRKAESEYLRIV